MVKTKISYSCSQCSYHAPSYLGRCPECDAWGTFEEHITEKPIAAKEIKRSSVLKQHGIETLSIPLSEITAETHERFSSGYPELDRVLGGGIMPGSYTLIGGDPGIGKSTLMLQVAGKLATEATSQPLKVLYIAGEESSYQIKMRAERLGLNSRHIRIYPETEIHRIIEEIRSTLPDIVIIDSIQSVYSPELSGTPGSVGQIKECAGMLMGIAKGLNIAIFLIGHVTKEGNVSGPKLLEHTVDAVLYFEGEKYNNLRILRTIKNRFGSTQEIGVFEITENGLSEVLNPSELFLSESSFKNLPGSVIVSTLEGSRPMLVEIQALVGQSAYAAPRRVANGVEYNRLHQIVAVLERRLGLDFSHQDVYINVVGGLKIEEPAADLGIALAVITSHRNISIRPGTVVSGEIGLTGEIRPISRWESRLAEAEKIGFKRIILPPLDKKSMNKKSQAIHQAKTGMELIGIHTLMDAVRIGLSPGESSPENSPETSREEELLHQWERTPLTKP